MSSCEKEAWKKSRLEQESNPWPHNQIQMLLKCIFNHQMLTRKLKYVSLLDFFFAKRYQLIIVAHAKGKKERKEQALSVTRNFAEENRSFWTSTGHQFTGQCQRRLPNWTVFDHCGRRQYLKQTSDSDWPNSFFQKTAKFHCCGYCLFLYWPQKSAEHFVSRRKGNACKRQFMHPV